MIISELELGVMQLCHFLVLKKGYQIMQLQGFSDDTWLFSADNQEFPLIRIVKKPANDVDRERVLQVKDPLQRALRIQGTTLVIYFDVKNSDMVIENGVKEIGIDSVSYQEIGLHQYFEGADKIFVPSVDIIEEYHRYKKEIDGALKKRALHKKMKLSIKDLPFVSIGVSILCVIIWMLGMYLSQTYGDSVAAGIAIGAYYRTFVIVNHDYWRLLSAGFVHLDFLHLFMNVVSLLNVGIAVEKFYGKGRYALLLLSSIIVASIFAHLDQSTTMVLGLSGGVYGAFGSLMVIMFYTKAIQNRKLQRQLLNVVLINVVISLMPGISLAGHLGGFIAGTIAGLLLIPNSKWKAIRLNTAIASLALVAFMGYRLATPKPILNIYPGTDIKVIELYQSVGFKQYAKQLTNRMEEFYRRNQ